MNAQLPVRRLMDDFHFYLARTELPTSSDNERESWAPLPEPPGRSDAIELPSQAVRSYALAGTARGHGLAVSYFFDPGGSGTVLFKWRILLDSRCEPILVAHRNGIRFHQESGRLAGEFLDVLNRNERYLYLFGLVVGQREIAPPAIFELSVPPASLGEAIAASTESLEERRRKREAWKDAQYKEAARLATDVHALKREQAKIDAAACEKFGEE
jgi:hypothetical protein